MSFLASSCICKNNDSRIDFLDMHSSPLLSSSSSSPSPLSSPFIPRSSSELIPLNDNPTTVTPPQKCSRRQVQLPETSFYKRTLPNSCISFNSPQGKFLFKAALHEGNLESYFGLSMQFTTQTEPASDINSDLVCGISSLCMTLNSLEVDPMRQWKGVWRWYDESMVDCCRPLDEIKVSGITLPEFACLGQCNGLNAVVCRAGKVSKQRFRDDLLRSSKRDDEIMIVNFDRATLEQTGAGHFSPIGGFCEETNQVLVLDVARFKYPPYWVNIDLLWDALLPLDSDTGKSRGYCLCTRSSALYFTTSALSSLSLTQKSWPILFKNLYEVLPQEIQRNSPSTLETWVERVVECIPDEYVDAVKDRRFLFLVPILNSQASGESKTLALQDYIEALDLLLHSIATTKLYRILSKSVAAARKNPLKRQSLYEGQISASSSSSSLVNLLNTLHSENLSTPSIINAPGFVPEEQYLRQRRVSSTPTNLLGIPRRNSPPPHSPQQAFNSNSISSTPLHPPSSGVNDFICFLTLFLFALFSYKTIHEELPEKLSSQISILVDLSKVPVNVVREVRFLKEQIGALTDLCQESDECLKCKEKLPALRNVLSGTGNVHSGGGGGVVSLEPGQGRNFRGSVNVDDAVSPRPELDL